MANQTTITSLANIFLSWKLILAAVVIEITIRYVCIGMRPGLRRIHGPFAAGLSDFDRVWSCMKGNQMQYHLRLHEKYGSLVRVGPNHVSVADVSANPLLYGIASKFHKSNFYSLLISRRQLVLLRRRSLSEMKRSTERLRGRLQVRTR